MKLNDSQIEDLYVFTRKHYVEYYDVQIELVDHLALAIEDQWKVKPQLPFEDALQIEFKKFGVFGFTEMVEQRQKAMARKYSKLIWKHLKEYFKLPKILLLLALTMVIYGFISTQIIGTIVLTIIITAVIIGIAVDGYRKRIKRYKLEKEGKKKWLFEEMIFQYGTGMTVFLFPIQFLSLINSGGTDISSRGSVFIAVLSFIVVLMLMVGYIISFEITRKAQIYLEQTYPEYKLVN